MEGGYLLGLLVLVLPASWCFQLGLSECDRVHGPEGYTDCMYSADFSSYQWAVCISNAKIQAWTKDEHFCQDRSAKYCWYPCMLLMTSKSFHHVNDLCKCDQNKILSKKSPLSIGCFLPETSNCDWYTGCTSSNVCSRVLAKELSIMKELCTTFSRIEGVLSSTGIQYSKAVHRCLRKPFHTLLYPESNLQCEGVRSMFHSSSTHCFTSPEEGISIQDLETTLDKVSLHFNSIATLSDYEHFQSSVRRFQDILFNADLEMMRKQIFKVQIAYKKSFQENGDKISEELVKFIIGKSGLQENLIVWTSRGQTKMYHNRAEMILCSKKNCVFDGQHYGNIDILSKLTATGNDVKNGKIRIVHLSAGNVEVLSYKICADNGCLSTYQEVDGGGNSGCIALDGKCQDDAELCDGSYLSGKCKSEPVNVRCCTKNIVDKDKRCKDIGGTCEIYRKSSKYCGGTENGYTSYLCSKSNEKCCAPCQCTKKAKELACDIEKLYDQGKIILNDYHPSRVQDDAYAVNNINDTCNGDVASRSNYSKSCPKANCPAPGGTICLSERVLKYIHNLASSTKYGTLQVNEIAGACHGCNSRHYRGLAVDLHISKTTTSSRTNQAKEYIDLCQSMQGWAQDESHHIHCQFYDCDI